MAVAPIITGDVVLPPGPADPAVMEVILHTIRTLESNGNYTAQATGATASGAYQFINSSWKAYALQIPSAAQFATKAAKYAPPGIQDLVAKHLVQIALDRTDNHLAGVPVYWYWPIAWTTPAELDKKPMGNPLTVRAYAEKWLKQYSVYHGASTGPGSGNPDWDTPGRVVGTTKVGDPVYNNTGGLVGYISDAAGTVVDTAGNIVGNAADFVQGVVGTFTSVVDFLNKLADPSFLIRVVKVTAGVAAIVVGVVVIAKDTAPVQAAQKAATTAAKTAAMV